ncbi:MAG: UTP--glucose-1-phosphate uridylyltransferase [Dehalococcoidales bacterium]|jgi:UTP--glucose-1-phosphate uridylyltransferase|nr:UTP--glucose-1-phosphate uridylyltransferase [Dehalococcoidales bacterium]|tara:strand:+ start:789 stop:1649 length:861 start_codon:yes stop_codon:yes gene_type:complete
MKIRKAVIVAAGRGTRFLPITRSQPKEMLPLVNKPLIQYSVEEAVNSGIEQIFMITAMGKRAIEDYFDRSFELEYVLEQKRETKLLQEMRQLSNLVDICYIRQKEQLGLGHAILATKDIIGEEPFAILLPDDIIDSKVPALGQLIEVYEQHKTNVLAVERISRQDMMKYGIIEPKKVSESVYQVLSLVEKPEPTEAPSDLGVVGRYILTPQIFDAIEVIPSGKNQEIQLTDALQLLLKQQTVYAYEFEGVRYDTGTPLGWLKTTVAFALKNPDIGAELREYLRQLL